MLLSKVAKVVVQIAVGTAVGVMASDFSEKYVGKPLQKFMDSVAEKVEKSHN